MEIELYPPVKLVISGPVGAGKTTLINMLSETEVVNTDEVATEDLGKATTTVALDFGSFVIDNYPIHLFGTPGQERFDFMWDVLCEGAFGLLVLVAGDNPRDFPQARRILEYITSQIPIPFLIGVTRQDLERVWAPEDVAEYFDLPNDLVTGLNATTHEGCLQTLYKLFGIINQSFEEQQQAQEETGA